MVDYTKLSASKDNLSGNIGLFFGFCQQLAIAKPKRIAYMILKNSALVRCDVVAEHCDKCNNVPAAFSQAGA
jgi:hypothetical protein